MTKLFTLAFLSLLMVAAAGCAGQSACRKKCADYGVTDAQRCSEICTTSCEKLAADYGLAQERCESIQRGE